MNTTEMRKAVDEAKTTMRAADNVANDLAIILKGRLRSVYDWNLKELKKELESFNAKTGKWKEQK